MKKKYAIEETADRHGLVDSSSVRKDFLELSGSPVHGLQLVEIVAFPREPEGTKPTVHDAEARAIAAIRRLADGQGDPHLAAAIAAFLPRPAGRPRAKGPTPAQQRDDLLRRLRRSTFHDLPGIVAAGDILRAWRRYRHGPVLPADEPARTFWRLNELNVAMPSQRSIENILAKHS